MGAALGVQPLSRWALAVLGLSACSPTVAAPVGAPCSLDVACFTESCIPAVDTGGKRTGWAGGYCSGDCSSVDCPQGICLAMADDHAYCVSACSADSDCREGYVCATAVGACLPDCREGWSCGASLACNADNGNCAVTATGS